MNDEEISSLTNLDRWSGVHSGTDGLSPISDRRDSFARSESKASAAFLRRCAARNLTRALKGCAGASESPSAQFKRPWLERSRQAPRAKPEFEDQHRPESINREVIRVALLKDKSTEGIAVEMVAQRRIAAK